MAMICGKVHVESQEAYGSVQREEEDVILESLTVYKSVFDNQHLI